MAYAGFSKGGGGGGNLRIMKTKRKISPLRISPFFGPKLGEDKKKGLRSDLLWFLAQNLVKTLKKKGLQSDLVRCCAPQTFGPSYKGGAMPQFYMLLYANYTILATQRGGRGAMPP